MRVEAEPNPILAPEVFSRRGFSQIERVAVCSSSRLHASYAAERSPPGVVNDDTRGHLDVQHKIFKPEPSLGDAEKKSLMARSRRKRARSERTGVPSAGLSPVLSLLYSLPNAKVLSLLYSLPNALSLSVALVGRRYRSSRTDGMVT